MRDDDDDVRSDGTEGREDERAAVYVSPVDLVPWEANPRAITDAAVAKVRASIDRFGFASPIVARLADRRIIAGHTRHRAALLEPRLSVVPVRFLDLSEAEADVLAVADNRLGEEAEWDWAGLSGVLKAFAPTDLPFTGFDAAELEPLLAATWTPPAPEPLPQPGAAAVGLRIDLDAADVRAFEEAWADYHARYPEATHGTFVADLIAQYVSDLGVERERRERRT
jgi:ParB-like chromosome segregation protein Spo0J